MLWIGYHQFWREHHTHRPQEPILEDTGTIECRDAVLAWDAIRHDPSRDRPDPTPRIKHPVTGELVPDPSAKLKYMEYVNPRRAEWPEADFIVGNPPYIGEKRQRDELGDGYVTALRNVYDDVSDSVDYVMYWWTHAARLVATGEAIRSGLITTNTITQAKNRVAIEDAQQRGARVIWAVAGHPWVEEADGAAVRVSMTVVGRDEGPVRIAEVDDTGTLVRERLTPRLNADLSGDVDLASAAGIALQANNGLANQGYKLGGRGFLLSESEAKAILAKEQRNGGVLKELRSGRDLSGRPRGVWVVDFGLMEEVDAKKYPILYERLRDRVKPERAANAREAYRRLWWRFLEPRRELRSSLEGTNRFLATLEVSKHRFFQFLPSSMAPDGTLVCIASQDAFHFGVLSSGIHVTWCLAAGGTLEDRPRYNKGVCFDAFPFPARSDDVAGQIAVLAEELDAHRSGAIERDEAVTMTGMYNVVEKLRSGEALTPKDRKIHEIAACGVLKDLHDELDALVAKAYGWEWPLAQEEILERLVALHDERVKEEQAGKVRWLRPEYQISRFGKDLPEAQELGIDDMQKPAKAAKARKADWPGDVISQFQAIKQLFATEALNAAEVAARFKGAKGAVVERHIDTLYSMGELLRNPDGRYQGPA